jgi:hypothetical protein
MGLQEKIDTNAKVIAMAAVKPPIVQHVSRNDLLGKIRTRNRRRAILVTPKRKR